MVGRRLDCARLRLSALVVLQHGSNGDVALHTSCHRQGSRQRFRDGWTQMFYKDVSQSAILSAGDNGCSPGDCDRRNDDKTRASAWGVALQQLRTGSPSPTVPWLRSSPQ